MALPLNWFAQFAAITRFSLLSIPERKGACAAAAVGIGGVVAVLVGTLSIAQGFRQAMTASGSPSVAVVLRSGSNTEMVSFLGGESVRLISEAPGVTRTAAGALASPELFVIISLPKRDTGTDANVPIRGVRRVGFEVRDDVRVIEGRRFVLGRNEVIVGRGAAREFTGLDVGSRLRVGKNEWRVVGLFTARGGIAESEIWTDSTVLQSAYQRGNSYQSVLVRLTSPGAFDTFRDALMRDPRLNVKVVRQSDYYAEQSRTMVNLITGLGSIIAGLMGLGAVFGALNTMYSAVAARTREIATLRALGFGSAAVVSSVLLESLLLALAGGAAGAAGAYLAFDGFRAATMNFQSFSQVAFAFAVTPRLLALGLGYALLIGLVGGLFPAIRAARLPVATALRES
jgi:putative ABC transport system permease protein